MRWSKKFLLLVAAFVALVPMAKGFAAEGVSCEEPVATAAGLVKGVAETGTATCSWKGIPFAAPPVGELRWKAPQPAPAWPGVREAKADSAMCLQAGMMVRANGRKDHNYSEDCLYLNVWRPRKSGSFPVMVWIHGGGYTGGTGASPMYGGDRLAEKGDLVIVTINYRLNAFGFLATAQLAKEDPHGSAGSYGSLDQVAALQWVHDNIANFGGNPNQVTIFGESAGGWSVCTMLATPLARGLFQGAILESGGCEASHTLERGFQDGRAAAKKLGCAEDDLACLRSKPAAEVLKKVGKTGATEYPFMPHEDGYLLSGTPLSMIRAGHFNNVPLIAGSNRNEVPKVMAVVKPSTFHARPSQYGKKVHQWVEIEDAAPLLALYPLSQYQKPRYGYAQMFSDRALICPTYAGLTAVAKQQPQTFYYRFDFDGFRWGKTLGAFHAMELPLVFNTLDRSPYSILYKKPEQRGPAQALCKIIQGYWINFAKTGDPNGPGLPEWPRYASGDKVQVLNTAVTTEPANLQDRAQFWADYNRTHPSLFDAALKKPARR